MIPPELTDAVAQVAQALEEGDLVTAKAATRELTYRSAHSFGPEHPHTLETYALDAYISYLDGDQARSTAASLRLARLRFSQSDARAPEEVLRAFATWELLTAPHTTVRLGEELLSVWTQIMGDAIGAAAVHTIRNRLSAFTHVPVSPFANGASEQSNAP
ncbi:hypothetical protein [Streptomyces sp. IB201691-2A2]|uniref:hypothetical protein n=1 Tax=Streptomyces sp. IB201691-2A2 TaxID=2561920 RepID=UPI00117C3DD0|nr:hypothetical protein [Streptomyces sp. IB201691-2A2]TRO56023.1 hypothetical protein E4K73_48300 [Streptomyces sp. IB201691-2A2]